MREHVKIEELTEDDKPGRVGPGSVRGHSCRPWGRDEAGSRHGLAICAWPGFGRTQASSCTRSGSVIVDSQLLSCFCRQHRVDHVCTCVFEVNARVSKVPRPASYGCNRCCKLQQGGPLFIKDSGR